MLTEASPEKQREEGKEKEREGWGVSGVGVVSPHVMAIQKSLPPHIRPPNIHPYRASTSMRDGCPEHMIHIQHSHRTQTVNDRNI